MFRTEGESKVYSESCLYLSAEFYAIYKYIYVSITFITHYSVPHYCIWISSSIYILEKDNSSLREVSDGCAETISKVSMAPPGTP